MPRQLRQMRDRELEARRSAEQELAAERKRVDETIQMVTEMVNEFREERRLASEERRQHAAATQQALLDTIVRLTEQRNGRREDSPET